QRHQRAAVGQGMREGGRGGGVGGKLVRVTGPEQADHLRQRGAGSGPVQELDRPQPQLLDAGGRGAYAVVLSLGQYNAAARAPGPLVQHLTERHFPNFCLRAWPTAGCTSCDTSPPKRATSRTRLELRYVRSNAGTRNTVSTPGARLRFMSAIWNSYSKSLTARRPRTISVAPAARTKAASRPSNDRTSTLGSTAAFWISATRSSSVNSGCFATLTATAMMTRSANVRARRIRSSWPRVMGSNEPG